jgi:hypothetical protein
LARGLAGSRFPCKRPESVSRTPARVGAFRRRVVSIRCPGTPPRSPVTAARVGGFRPLDRSLGRAQGAGASWRRARRPAFVVRCARAVRSALLMRPLVGALCERHKRRRGWVRLLAVATASDRSRSTLSRSARRGGSGTTISRAATAGYCFQQEEERGRPKPQVAGRAREPQRDVPVPLLRANPEVRSTDPQDAVEARPRRRLG